MLSKHIIKQIQMMLRESEISQAPEDLLSHSYDASKQAAKPDLIIKAKNKEEISRVVRLAHEQRIPIYPRGAASGLTGGTVPTQGGIVIDINLMNKIIEINEQDLIAQVEPGVVVADFQKEVGNLGLFYPPDPASSEFCTMAGNVAECAGGLRGVKYGVTRDYVLGLEVVLATGEIINTGSHTLKSVTGYDLTRLLVGSEGTLGIFTKITVRLIPKPEHIETLMAFFDSIPQALKTGNGIMNEGILPRALEFMDETSTRAVQKYQGELKIPTTTKAILLIEVDGRKQDAQATAQHLHKYLTGKKALQVTKAKNPTEAQKLWAIRKAISPALYSLAPKKVNEDICVPLSKLPAMLEAIRQFQETYKIPVATFGHLGDGNLHVNFLISVPGQEQVIEQVVDEFFRTTLELRGTLSGEHGIGLSKAKYFNLEVRPAELQLMKQLKSVFDPKGIMNPGKIF